MKLNDFLHALNLAVKANTLYIKGGFGLTLNARGKQRAIEQYAYNKKRAAKINAMPNNSFGFDCCGLVKGCLSGFCADPKKTYGGAVYNKDNTLGPERVPDTNESGLLDMCLSVQKCKKVVNPSIPVGAFLWLKGHCGVYIGDNKVIESTPSWKDGAQITNYTDRTWIKYGLLPFIEDYKVSPSEPIAPGKNVPPVAKPTLRIGSRGSQVYYLQKDLNYLGASLSEDGIYGPKTKNALMAFQKKYNLAVDGIYGPRSYNMMREVIK